MKKLYCITCDALMKETDTGWICESCHDEAWLEGDQLIFGSIIDDYDYDSIYDEPKCCKSCGNPIYPDCMESCKLFN